MGIEVADDGSLGANLDPDDHFETMIEERQEEDIFLARARSQAEHDFQVHGTTIDEQRIWDEADRLRKRYNKKVKHLEKAQDIQERERTLERREAEMQAKEEAHQRVLDRIQAQIEAGRTGNRDLNSEDAQAAIAAVLDDRLDDLIKLRSNAHTHGMAKAMLIGLQAFPIGLGVGILQLFIPDDLKPWVLTPCMFVIVFIGMKWIKVVNQDLGITSLKGEDSNGSNRDRGTERDHRQVSPD